MNFDIKKLSCDKMLIHPLSPNLVKYMETNMPQIKDIDIKFKKNEFNKPMIYRYVLLMYDPNSEVHNRHSLEWYEKKFQACGYAGFPMSKGRDGYMRFSDDVLNMIIGKNDAINDVIFAFLGYVHNVKWNYTVFLYESMLLITRDAVGGKKADTKTSGEYRKLYDEFFKLSNEIAHTFEETEEFVSRFYYQIEQSRLAIRPEDYSKAIANGDDFRADNPYGVNYEVELPKFLGDDEEQVRERIQRG